MFQTLNSISCNIKIYFFYSIENFSKVTIWSSNHVNFINDNAIEMNFDDLLFKVLHLFFIREFNFINMNLVNFRIHSFRIKLINVYDLNEEIRFYKCINWQCVFDWCLFVWFIYENVHFQSCDNNRRQFICCYIIKIVNDIQNHVEFDESNIFKNCLHSIRNICFKNVKHCRFFYRTNMIKKWAQLIWTLNEKLLSIEHTTFLITLFT